MTDPVPVLTDDEVQRVWANNKIGELIISPEIDALCATVRALRAERVDHVLITAVDNATYDRLVKLLLEEDYEPAGSLLDADDILKQVIAERNALRETLTALRSCQNKPTCGHCAALLRAAASLTPTDNTKGRLT